MISARRLSPRTDLTIDTAGAGKPTSRRRAVTRLLTSSSHTASGESALRERLAEPPSFVAFEGYDTIAVLADLLRAHGPDRARLAESWPRVCVEGTRGQIRFCRAPGISVWQWAWAPAQVADRDPAEPGRFRVRRAT